MKVFLLKHESKLGDVWEGISVDESDELCEFIGRPLPIFYQYFFVLNEAL